MGKEFEGQWKEAAWLLCRRLRTSRPYKKTEQAFADVFNQTLRKECLGWVKYHKQDLPTVQAAVFEFLDYYNNIRPHLSLNLRTPTAYLSHLR